jgi:hypothetical protein
MVTEANKLTLGQELTVLTLTEYKGNYWLTNSQMVKYQSMLCENPCIRLEVVKTLNLSTQLLIDTSPPEHDCLEVIDEVFLSWLDLTDQPFSNLGQHLNRWQQLCPEWYTLCCICGGNFGLSE